MCLFALELWSLPVTEADCTISHLPKGEVDQDKDTDYSPSFTPSDFSRNGTFLALFFLFLFSKAHSLMLPCPVSPPTAPPSPRFCYNPPPNTTPSGAWWEEVMYFGESKSEASQVPGASAASSAAWVFKRGGEGTLSVSFWLPCHSIGLLVYLWWRVLAHPSSLFYPCLRCSYPGSGEGGFATHTHTRSLHEWRELMGSRTRGYQQYLSSLHLNTCDSLPLGKTESHLARC